MATIYDCFYEVSTVSGVRVTHPSVIWNLAGEVRLEPCDMYFAANLAGVDVLENVSVEGLDRRDSERAVHDRMGLGMYRPFVKC